MRRILVVNDDGIGAEGIVRLAAAAKNLGEVWVVAPGQQCSAMSTALRCGEACKSGRRISRYRASWPTAWRERPPTV